MTINALILMGVVYGLTEMVKAIVPDNVETIPWVKVLSALAVALASVFLVAETRWASQQFVGDQSLDKLDWADKLVVTVFIAGGAALVQRSVKAVTSIGQNPVTDVQQRALDAGAERLVRSQLHADQGGSHPTSPPPTPNAGVDYTKVQEKLSQ